MSRYKNELQTPVTITQSDTSTTFLNRPLKGIYILTADAATPDTIKVLTVEDTIVTITLPLFVAGAGYPIFFEFGIKRVYNTDTTLADAEMLGVY